jgi:hypothetical protein
MYYQETVQAAMSRRFRATSDPRRSRADRAIGAVGRKKVEANPSAKGILPTPWH